MTFMVFELRGISTLRPASEHWLPARFTLGLNKRCWGATCGARALEFGFCSFFWSFCLNPGFYLHTFHLEETTVKCERWCDEDEIVGYRLLRYDACR